MATNNKLPALTELTAPANADLIYIVDVSDTTQDDSGTSKRITYSNLISGVLSGLGITASVAELNVLDGIPTTLTATELGYVDGVTSAIQTQLNGKQATLVSGTNIKSIMGSSILASGDVAKATGATIDTGTADDDIVTSKSLKDSKNVPSVAPGTSGNVLTSDGTDWTSAAGVTADSTTTFTNKTLTSPVLQGNIDGWIADTDTWVYVSASSFKIEGKDVTTKFTKGTRLKFTQTTAKYAVVIASSFSTDTTVTILTNTDYTIANAAITSPYYSYQMSPQGYPGWFNVAAPTWNVSLIDNGSGGQPTTTTHKIAVNGNTLEGWIHGSGTKAGADWYFGYTNPYGVTPLFTRGIGACNAYWGSTDYSGVVNYDSLIYLTFESDRGISDNQAIAGFFARFSFQF